MQQQQERVKPTLKRTKYACVNCKAAKAACDSNRPCGWCVRHALQDSCVDAPRKTRMSKKICCDPSIHRNAVFKNEYKGFQLALASDFLPSTCVPAEPPLSPPAEIFPIEDFLAPGGFDFGINNSNAQCTNCPLYQNCSKDASQRLICATSNSPPNSPLSPELQDDETSPAAPGYTPMSLSSHPDYCLEIPKQDTPSLSDSINNTPTYTPPPTTPLTVILQQPQTPETLHHSSTTTPTTTPPQITTPATPQQQFSPGTPQQLVQPQQARVARTCGSSSSPSFPPLLDDMCNCQVLVQREMAKINASLDTISALMQLQNITLLPTAAFRLPDTTLEDCNNEFAKILGYENREDMLSAATVDSITESTKDLTVSSSAKPKQSKIALTSLVPEANVSSVLKYAASLMKATVPSISQIVLSKKGDMKFFTVLIKPCGWFAYISILKQHPQIVDGLCMCGE